MPQRNRLLSGGVYGFEAAITIQRREKMASAPHRPGAERPARFVRPAAQFALFALPFCTRFIGFAALIPGAALANGIPMPGQVGFQEAATPSNIRLRFFTIGFCFRLFQQFAYWF
jgi:hypothetical protein